MENKNAKNPYYRYTYQVGSVENGEVVVTLHYKIGKEFVQTAQDVNNNMPTSQGEPIDREIGRAHV